MEDSTLVYNLVKFSGRDAKTGATQQEEPEVLFRCGALKKVGGSTARR